MDLNTATFIVNRAFWSSVVQPTRRNKKVSVWCLSKSIYFVILLFIKTWGSLEIDERKHFQKYAFFSLFGPKMCVMEYSLDISTSNKLHCRIIWLNITGFECIKVWKMWRRIEKMVVSYPYPLCFHSMRHIYRATLWLPYKPMGCAIRIFINISALRQCWCYTFQFKTHLSLTRHF